ncbi:MAG: type II toxin-antitoxin system VapC family toxin [Actinomycetota bacterium]|nr:type II toxin-antitoxin system VapC family toxin [Actinomycetota bacterium]
MTLLVDASVWGKLAEPGDRFHRQARDLLVDSAAALAALDLTLFEIANAVGVKMGQPKRAEWLSELVAIRSGERLVRVDPRLVATAVEVAAQHGLTAYDAAYVATARRNGWQLVSFDTRDLVSKGLAVTPDAADYP